MMSFEENVFGILENSVESLQFNGRLKQEQAESFCEALAKNYSLSLLQLRYNMYSRYRSLSNDFVPTLLANALKLNSTLIELNLSHNAIQDEGIRDIAEALKQNKGLRVLNLTDNSIGDLGGRYLSEALWENDTLNMLNLKYNHIGYTGAFCIARSLQINQTLIELSFDSNNIEDEGVDHLAEALKVNETLLKLNLTDNGITGTGVKALALALRVNNHLVDVNLSTNLIDDGSAGIIADTLKANDVLRKLDLNFNYIANEGAKCIAESLISNKSLTELYLDSNDISDTGAHHFSKALEKNKTLVMLKLNEHFVSAGLLREISDKLDKNIGRKSKLFLDTLNGDKRTSWSRSRLMVVGQGKAGKSALVRSILGLPFNKNWDSTIGAEISESQIAGPKNGPQQFHTGWTKLKDQATVDYSSKFAARIMLKQLNKSQDAKENVTMESNKPKNMMNHIKEVEMPSISSNLKNSKTKNVENKTTIFQRRSEKAEAVRNFDVDLLLDAENTENSLTLSVWDFGGQEVFYSMHHLFLTKSGVYILVFDMREILQWNNKNDAIAYLSFWLRSIRLHAPSSPLLLVGTYMRDIQSRAKGVMTVNGLIRKLVKSLGFNQLVKNSENKLSFFPIDNKERIGITMLRREIEQIVRKDRNTWQNVSIKWILLLDEMLEKRSQYSYIHLSDVTRMATKVGINQAAEVDEALGLFHEQGMLVHLTATDTLRNLVIVKPQWIIDAISKVIRDGSLHSYNLQAIEKHGLAQDLKLAFDMGLVSRDFLEYVWNSEQVHFLVDLMKRTLLMSEWNYRNEECYLVPSLLKHISRTAKHGDCFALDFSGSFLPTGLFQRLICLVVSHSASNGSRHGYVLQEPELNKNTAFIEIEPHFHIFLKEDVKQQQIVAHVGNSQYAAKSVQIIQSMVKKVNCDVMGEGLKWDILVENPLRIGKLVNYDRAKEEMMAPWITESLRNTELETQSVDLDLFLNSLQFN